MQPTMTIDTTATIGADASTLSEEDRLFLAAIQDREKREQVIAILKLCGSIPA